MIRFELSTLPPSVNGQTRVGTVTSKATGKRIPRKMKTPEYEQWCSKADLEIMMQPGRLPDGCYYAAFFLIPASCRGDLDNYSKALLDLAVRMGRIPDDKMLVDMRVKFHDKPTVVVGFCEERVSQWQFVKRSISKTLKRARS